MPVTVDEVTGSVATPAPAPRERESAPNTAAGNAGLRRELRGMSYADGASRLSPRAAEAVDSAASATTTPAAPPTQLGSAGATVSTDGGTVQINAPVVRINAAMTQVEGVLRADTVIATNVVGSSYTPGAGNVL